MSLPRKDFKGQSATLTMMEFRSSPGDAVDRAAHGAIIHIEKNGKIVAALVRAFEDDTCIVHPDGSMTGIPPVTLRRNLGEGPY